MILRGSSTTVEQVGYPRELLVGFAVVFQEDGQELVQEFLCRVQDIVASGDHPLHTLLRYEGRAALVAAMQRNPQEVFAHLTGRPYRRRNCWTALLEDDT
jgi:hypothetical protein